VARFVLSNNVKTLNRIADPSDPLRAYGQHRERAYRRQAKLGIDPYQSAYRPLSSRYAREKARTWGSKPVLWASGRMNKSHKVTVRGSRVTESLQSPAVAHYKGVPSRNIPKRPPLPDSRGLPQSDLNALWNAVVANARRAF
jgi:hypothetical protein